MATLIEKAHSYIFELFKDKLPQHVIYHNFAHTERVLKSTRELIAHSEVSEEDAKVLQLAAILHDAGYTVKRIGHEEESVRLATEFLEGEQVDPAIIAKVNACIMATKFEHHPTNELEEIIKDADTSHFGKDYFEEASELLRKELELAGVITYTPNQWLKQNIAILTQKHTYYTTYALEAWQPQKAQHLTKLIKRNKKRKKKLNVEKLKAKYKAQYKQESPERGIQTFYRVALRNHIKLSDIADTKANILLSVNAIIISLVLSNLLSKLDNPSNSYMIMPTAIFIVFSVIAMILSVLATRPNITRGEFTKQDVEDKKVNLTFFGNFHKMELKEYEWAISELLLDKDYVYSSLTKDLYFLGKVLDRKYRILRVTYTIFMVGIVVSVIAFGLAFKYRKITTGN